MKHNYLKNLFNSFDFWIRNNLSVSRGLWQQYSPSNEPKTNLCSFFAEEEAEKKEAIYLLKYEMQTFKNSSTIINYIENLYIIELLEKYLDDYLNTSNNKTASVLDIGCKNWFYAFAESAYFKSKNNICSINGIEVDPNRLYTNFFSRADYAGFYTKNLTNTKYLRGNVLDHNSKYDIITWFLPFITYNPHQAWGLPDKLFQPEKTLQQAYNLLNDNGLMLIMNQGKEEAAIQEKMLLKFNIDYDYHGIFESCFMKYKHERHIFVVKKIK